MAEVIVTFLVKTQKSKMKKIELTDTEFNIEKGKLEKPDIQALIFRGYKQLHAASYILLQIKSADDAKKYFRYLITKITTADITGNKFVKSNDPTNAVNIAFSSSGLKKLGLDKNELSTFSREFLEGISYVDDVTKIEERSTLLGDTGFSHPKNWYWGNNEDEKRVDCILMLFAKDNLALQDLKSDVDGEYNENAFKEICLPQTYEDRSPEKKEHFGFRDGISQPIINGFGKTDREKFGNEFDNEEVINPGEFILGYENSYTSHYKSPYTNYSRSPYVDASDRSAELPPSREKEGKRDLGKNGTYMVFRQIEQHVERFWQYHLKHSKETAATPTEKAIKLAAKMVGRWPNGQPLTTNPSPTCPMKEPLNDFAYNAQDKDGINCPFGAHIRRANPRDQVHAGRRPENSLEVSNKHRMLRRGRIYGEPLDKQMNIDNMINKAKDFIEPINNFNGQNCQMPGKRGLHFICLVSDIGRQFEFIQSVWANTPTFADLSNEVDPLISSRSTPEKPNCNKFTTPQKTIRNRYMEVPEFTTVVGGAYFFMPGKKALKYILR
jgi:Dyp-type peroxidase family